MEDPKKKKLRGLADFVEEPELATYSELQDINEKLDSVGFEVDNLPDRIAEKIVIPEVNIPEVVIPEFPKSIEVSNFPEHKMPEFPTEMTMKIPGVSVITLKGEQGEPGKDGKDAEVDNSLIIDTVLGLMPKPENGKNGSPDTGDDIVDKINSTEKKINEKNLELSDISKKIEDIRFNVAGISALPPTTSFINGRRAKNLNFTGATISYGEDTATISIASSGGVWGTITGTLSNQTDLQAALDLKAPLISPTFATSITGSYLTASEILITNGSKQIVSASVATYPSLTELTYVKGVTSAIQTQLNTKQATISLTTTGTSGAATFIANTLNIPQYAGGVSALSAIGSSANANGATITGTTLNLEPADASFGGVVTTAAQTFAGRKTFNGYITIAAGTATAGTAPLKFTAGTNLTTPEAGAMEFTTGNFWFSPSTTNRIRFGYGGSGSSGASNLAIGVTAGTALAGGTANNTYIGTSAGAAGNGIGNTAVGASAMFTHTGYTGNVAIGEAAMNYGSGSYNIGIGDYALFADSAANNSAGCVAIGANAFYKKSSGNYGIAIGYQAGKTVTSAANGIYIGYGAVNGGVHTGTDTIAIGQESGKILTSGAYNILVGYKAGDAITTGSNNVIIGKDIDAQGATTSDQLSIQNAIFGTGNSGTGTTASTGKIGIYTVAPTCALDVTGGIATSRTAVTAPATTDGNIFSGTYTPTLTGVTNVASSTAYACQYMRVGSVVTVSGKIEVTPTANNTQTTIGISLPIASNFANSQECGGSAHTVANTVLGHGAAMYGDATNNRVEMDYYETHGASDTFSFQFTYQII